jgi:aldose 1-epimerase
MLCAYTVDGRDAVVPFAPGTPPPAYNGAVLAPWPNRLRDGAYQWRGQRRQVPVNEPDRRTALHGLVFGEIWTPVAMDASSATLALRLTERRGWPGPLDLRVCYSLSAAGLTVTVTASNPGVVPLPYGVGFHPWLSTGGAALDDCALTLDAATHVRVDDRLLPAGTEPVAGCYDLRRPTRLAGLDLDDAWIDATADESGRSWGRLACPDGRTVSVWMEAPLDCWQVCTGDHVDAMPRAGLALEPMTCVADAFNTGAHLITLEPGASCAVRWGIQVS